MLWQYSYIYVTCKGFLIDIVTKCLCDVWSFLWLIFVWRVKALWLILWWCFCVTCESLCDWYCDVVFVWHVKVLWCGDIVTMFQSVWGVKVLWSGDIVSMFLCDVWKICAWYRYCDDVFVWEWRFFVTLEAAWQYFFFWINFDFGPRGPDCGPTGRNLWLWC